MRKEQAALARKKIIDATEKLIQKTGYEDILISDITSACKMSQGNFYHYFKSKNELFEEIDSIKFYEYLDTLMSDVNSSVLSRLESFFLGWIDLTLNYYGSNYSNAWALHYAHRPAQPGIDKNRFSVMYDHIIGILENGIDNDELRNDAPVECMAYSITYTLFGCTTHFGITDDRDTISKWATDYCNIYIKDVLSPYCITQT